MRIYTEEVIIRSDDLDDLGQIRLSALQKKIQTISDNHGSLLGFGFEDMTSLGLFWVVSRLFVEIQKPLTDQQYQMNTWLNPPTRTGVLRNYEMTSSQGEVVVRGVAKWSIVDKNTLSLKRSDDVSFLSDDMFWDRTLQFDFPVLTIIDRHKELQPDKTIRHIVQPSELDFNNHVNNTLYVDYLSRYFHLDIHIHKYQINFVRALYLGEEIEIEQRDLGDELVFEARLCNEKQEISFQARVWK